MTKKDKSEARETDMADFSEDRQGEACGIKLTLDWTRDPTPLQFNGVVFLFCAVLKSTFR